MAGKSPSALVVQTELIPDCVRESIGNILYKRFMENMPQHPVVHAHEEGKIHASKGR